MQKKKEEKLDYKTKFMLYEKKKTSMIEKEK